MPEIHRTMLHSNRRRNKSLTNGFSLYCSNVIDIIYIIILMCLVDCSYLNLGLERRGFMKRKILAIIPIVMLIISLSACGRKETLYEIPDLSQYKTDYVGDSSNVINIVSKQDYPEGYSYDSIEIQSETKPYGLTVFLKAEPSASMLEDELQVNADMTFDLIGNLGTLDYKTADSKEIIASYER